MIPSDDVRGVTSNPCYWTVDYAMTQLIKDNKTGKMCEEATLVTLLHHDALLRGLSVHIVFVQLAFSTNPANAGYQIFSKTFRMPTTRDEYGTAVAMFGTGSPLICNEPINIDQILANMHEGARTSSPTTL